ncbi:E3 ubiquitin-protein ligase makorin-like isoform X2 [Tasmannia lanceolata]|uniref:E3 ubiquitin-protein ligase makorin-like isoform X2 n=1 Tax=Tasmannia lanceolata TaxID=3420 RepID=UPI004062DA1C
MSKRVLCKFFVRGTCFKGELCEFSHDWKDQANNVCTFYQKGVCSFGSRCRYDHVKPSQPQSYISSSSVPHLHMASDSALVTHPSRVFISGEAGPISRISTELSASSMQFFPPDTLSWNQDSNYYTISDNVIGSNSTNVGPADHPICSFAAAGNCPNGEKCPHIHGNLCSTCGKHCLHPYRPDERDEHIKQCERNKRHLEALRRSQEKECSVCLERVLSKPTHAERKFGFLSECDHPFCISCIRNWRSNSPTSGMDVNSALRSCPVCRKHSYFVIPSVIWYSTKEEKQEIIDSYKSKLRISRLGRRLERVVR